MIAADSSGTPVVRVAVRAGLLVVAFAVALIAWGSIASLARLPARLPFSPDVGGAIAASLEPLVLSLILGGAIGVVAAAAGAACDRLELDGSAVGAYLKLAGRLGQLPWIAVSPFALAALWLVPFGLQAGSANALEILLLSGLVSTLVANQAYDPLRRGEGAAAALAALAGVGRGLVAGIGALILIESVTGRPGLGRTLVVAVVSFSSPGPLVTAFLVIGLIGSLLGLAGDLVPARAAGGAAVESPAQRWWRLGGVAALGLPLLALLVSFAIAHDATIPADLVSTLLPPSPGHPLGTNQLGQDQLTLLMAGYRNSLGLALLAAVPATLLGGLWGAAAAWIARGGANGGAIADAIVAPAWVVAVVPLLPSVILLRLAAPTLAVTIGLALALLTRLALAVRDLDPPDLTTNALLRTAAGVFLLSVAVVFVAGVGVDAVGVGTLPPTPSLGRLLGDSLPVVYTNPGAPIIRSAVWLSLLTVAPCLLAAWTLLRPCNRGQAWGRLYA
jgi:ABC-type dipeptide/oligopeptide/nickel transport system permease subunit